MLNWELWTATLNTNPRRFSAIHAAVYRFLNDTPDRVPMTDWYGTIAGIRLMFKRVPPSCGYWPSRTAFA